MDCIFCKIISGEIPSYCVYENEKIMAFLDVNPVSNGHTLIVPKKHFENLFDIDIDTLISIEETSQKVGKLLMEKLNCDGITRLQNNGYGQDVKHYHMHLIPRYKNDNALIKFNSTNQISVKEVLELIKKK